MQVLENISLRKYNTFRINVNCRHFVELDDDGFIPQLWNDLVIHEKKYLLLNGGSNILFTDDFDGLVIRIAWKGHYILNENNEQVVVVAKAGENWHQLVQGCVENNWGGLENLALIPGNVGAAPVQNIGAYGREQGEVMEWLDAFDTVSGEIRRFFPDDCRFGYRHSHFRENPGRYIILQVAYRLNKNPVVNLNYRDLQKWFSEKPASSITIRDVFHAVCQIRRSKLPDPDELPNAGSFFKNPVISKSILQGLIKDFPDIPFYSVENEKVKIPAAWLIEKAGWKGYREGDAGVYPTHSLILVNYGNATGKQLLELALRIQESVFTRFGINLEPEVNII